MMTGYEAAQRIANVLRANGVKDSNDTRYGLAYLIENALRHIANRSGNLLVAAGTNANPTLKYTEGTRTTPHDGPTTSIQQKGSFWQAADSDPWATG